MRNNFTRRDTLIHTARVYLAQSRHFATRHRGFSFLLLDWSAKCRRDALAESRQAQEHSQIPHVPKQIDHRQMDLFESNA